MSQPRVRVFWDLETCPPPTSHAPWEVLRDLRLFTSRFGVANSFKAYWDKNNSNNAADPLRAAMPSMGVNLVDCSLVQGYNEDALTRMLVVDVLILAIDEPLHFDTPTKDVIMILSGDEGVLYPISLLMFRNFTVFLVVPDGNHNIQPLQATQIFNLNRDILTSRIEKSAFDTPHTSIPPEAYTVTGSGPGGFVDYAQMLTHVSPPSTPTRSTFDDTNANSERETVDNVEAEQKGGRDSRSDCAIDGDRLQDPVEEPKGKEKETRKTKPNKAEKSKQGSTVPQTPKEIPMSAFEPLLQILREHRKSMGRSRLEKELGKKKNIYKAAGVAGSSDYIALAVANKIVIAAGVDDKAYVRLHPRLKNVQ